MLVLCMMVFTSWHFLSEIKYYWNLTILQVDIVNQLTDYLVSIFFITDQQKKKKYKSSGLIIAYILIWNLHSSMKFNITFKFIKKKLFIAPTKEHIKMHFV